MRSVLRFAFCLGFFIFGAVNECVSGDCLEDLREEKVTERRVLGLGFKDFIRIC